MYQCYLLYLVRRLINNVIIIIIILLNIVLVPAFLQTRNEINLTRIEKLYVLCENLKLQVEYMK